MLRLTMASSPCPMSTTTPTAKEAKRRAARGRVRGKKGKSGRAKKKSWRLRSFKEKIVLYQNFSDIRINPSGDFGSRHHEDITVW